VALALNNPQVLGFVFNDHFMEHCTTIIQHVRTLELSLRSIVKFSCRGWSTISPGGRHIVVSNLFDGLDFYSISDRTLSQSIPCPINQQKNVPIPVLFNGDGSSIIVGGTSGSVRVLDSSSCETVQVLPHHGQHVLFNGSLYLWTD
jgi:hypothetical protein